MRDNARTQQIARSLAGHDDAEFIARVRSGVMPGDVLREGSLKLLKLRHRLLRQKRERRAALDTQAAKPVGSEP
jgi:hypothetical protein